LNRPNKNHMTKTKGDQGDPRIDYHPSTVDKPHYQKGEGKNKMKRVRVESNGLLLAGRPPALQVVREIFTFLSLDDLVTVTRASKQCRIEVKSYVALLRAINYEHCRLPDSISLLAESRRLESLLLEYRPVAVSAFLERIVNHNYATLKRVSLPALTRKVCLALSRCTNLEELSIDLVFNEVEELPEVFRQCHKLQKVAIKDCAGSTTTALFTSGLKLVDVDIYIASATDLAHLRLPNHAGLKRLQLEALDETALTMLHAQCSSLIHLEFLSLPSTTAEVLDNPRKWSFPALKELKLRMRLQRFGLLDAPALESLYVSWIVTPEMLRSALTGCPKLKQFETCNALDEFVSLPVSASEWLCKPNVLETVRLYEFSFTLWAARSIASSWKNLHVLDMALDPLASPAVRLLLTHLPLLRKLNIRRGLEEAPVCLNNESPLPEPKDYPVVVRYLKKLSLDVVDEHTFDALRMPALEEATFWPSEGSVLNLGTALCACRNLQSLNIHPGSNVVMDRPLDFKLHLQSLHVLHDGSSSSQWFGHLMRSMGSIHSFVTEPPWIPDLADVVQSSDIRIGRLICDGHRNPSAVSDDEKLSDIGWKLMDIIRTLSVHSIGFDLGRLPRQHLKAYLARYCRGLVQAGERNEVPREFATTKPLHVRLYDVDDVDD
jgi:hypothetical protein